MKCCEYGPRGLCNKTLQGRNARKIDILRAKQVVFVVTVSHFHWFDQTLVYYGVRALVNITDPLGPML